MCLIVVFDHNSREARNVFCIVTRVPLFVAVGHRVVLFCVCGRRYGCIGMCGGCLGSSHRGYLIMIGRGGGIPPEPSVPGGDGASWWALFPRVSISHVVAM